jgi:hypothetical protein
MRIESQEVRKEDWEPLAGKIIALCSEHFDDERIELLEACSIIMASLKAVEATVKMYLKSEGAEVFGITVSEETHS